MPSKKKKYNARFPAGRIKKIMQTDEEVGKVAQAVPVIISRTLELFVGSLLNKAMQITSAKNAKTLSPSHMKQCILSEQRFDFLKDLVKTVQDTSNGEEDSVPGTPCVLTPGPNRAISQRRRSSTTVKEEPLPRNESIIKHGSVVKEEIKSEPTDYANCSTVHLTPNFYTETQPEQKLSVHRPPLIAGLQPPLQSYSDQIHSPPVLVMDEDYDT